MPPTGPGAVPGGIQGGTTTGPPGAKAAPPPSSSSEMSLNLNPKAKTISAPSSPAKSRESLLQRVQSLTGQAKEQGVTLLGKF